MERLWAERRAEELLGMEASPGNGRERFVALEVAEVDSGKEEKSFGSQGSLSFRVVFGWWENKVRKMEVAVVVAILGV